MTVGLLTAVAGSFKIMCRRHGLRESVWKLFAYKKKLGRTETRTRDRMWTVRDISRDDRSRIAICSLRTTTDRHTDRQTYRVKENYSVEDVLLRNPVDNDVYNIYQLPIAA